MSELFTAATSTPQGFEAISNGGRNKLALQDRSVHDWYRFVLSYPAHLVRQYLEDFNLKPSDTVLDPFCGTGTTLVEAKFHGIASVGTEANLFAHFASSVKTQWNIDYREMLSAAQDIADRTLTKFARQGISDKPDRHVTIANLREFTPEQEQIVLKGSISPIPLHKCFVLLDEINRFKGTTYYHHLRLAFANSLVFKVSNLRFGPEVGVGRARHDVPVVSEWLAEVEKVTTDLQNVSSLDYAESKVILSDARNAAHALKGQKISAVITSPPYPNEKDYSRTTRLESVMLGFVKNKAELRDVKKTLLRSNTRGVYREDLDDIHVDHISEIAEIADQIEKRRIELGKTSGFEKMYARVTKLYFGGMALHLKQLSSVLKPGAQLAYVVGDQASYLRVMIRTGQLIGKIAESLGYELVRIDQFRTRFATATKADLNEEVVVLRWPR